MVFDTDEEMQAYYLSKGRSVLVGSDLDRTDAIAAFRGGGADILVPVSGVWDAYSVVPLFDSHRKAVREMTKRLRALLLDSSTA